MKADSQLSAAAAATISTLLPYILNYIHQACVQLQWPWTTQVHVYHFMDHKEQMHLANFVLPLSKTQTTQQLWLAKS
jgi:hypothetical protein